MVKNSTKYWFDNINIDTFSHKGDKVQIKINKFISDGWRNLLNIVDPDLCLLSNEILEENSAYRYFSESSILKSTPPHSLNVRDRLLGEMEADELAFSKVISLFKIKDTPEILEPIHKFKYLGVKQIGEELGIMLSKLVNPDSYDCIVPIPIHHARRRERGFNQSEVLAQVISHRTSIKLEQNLLERKQYTYSQAKLDRADRRNNLNNKFRVSANYNFYNKRILLIDDVLTTATTVNYCSDILLRAGVRSVDVAVIAVSY